MTDFGDKNVGDSFQMSTLEKCHQILIRDVTKSYVENFEFLGDDFAI